MSGTILKRIIAFICLFTPFLIEARTNSLIPGNTFSFVENIGQIKDQDGNVRPDVQYRLSSHRVSVFVGKGELHYQFNKVEDKASLSKHFGPDNLMPLHAKKTDPVMRFYRLDVKLIGANANAEIVVEEKNFYHENYYNPGLGENGAIAHSFNKITYKNVYPKIDWVLYIKNNKMEYDFVVHPGANPDKIKIQYNGATTLSLTDNGSLNAITPLGSVTEQKPISYEQETGKEIASSFVLNGNVLSVKAGVHSGTLVIDPSLAWATYYGGSNEEFGGAVSADAYGNVYLAGSTSSSSNIATVGSYSNSYNGGAYDAFLVKFNSTGQRIWSTYYGGNDNDQVGNVACDSSGLNVYLAGDTYSHSGIASTGSWQDTIGNPLSTTNADAFLVKFDSSGSRQWATYYGGTGSEVYAGVTIDHNTNDVYLHGMSGSSTNIATPGTFQPTAIYGGGMYLAKFNSAGVRQWGTYFYGTGLGTYFYGPARNRACIDKWGNIYIGGVTRDTSGLATPGAFKTILDSINTPDGFLVKFNNSGQRIWCTYYGGVLNDQLFTVTCDDSGQVYVAGSTNSPDSSISSPGAFKRHSSSIASCFIAKFDSSGSSRLWGTYFGELNTNIFSMTCDRTNNISITGYSNNTDSIATIDGYKTNLGSASEDAFLVKFSATGQRLWGTYLGGDNSTSAGDVCVDKRGNLYFCGTTTSNDSLATPGSFSTNENGLHDAFLAKFNGDTIVIINEASVITSLCPGSIFNLAYFITGPFIPGNTFTAQLSNSVGSFASPTIVGTASSAIAGTITCTIPLATAAGTGYRIRIVASNPSYTSYPNETNIIINATLTPSVSISSVPSPVIAGQPAAYTANVVNGGTTPTFKWEKNGVIIPGATSNPYNTTVNAGDQIGVVLYSNAICASPDSALSNQITATTGISELKQFLSTGLQIYPNPNSGNFTISGVIPGGEKQNVFEISDVLGRIVYTGKLTVDNCIFSQRINLNLGINGLYFLRVISENSLQPVKIMINK